MSNKRVAEFRDALVRLFKIKAFLSAFLIEMHYLTVQSEETCVVWTPGFSRLSRTGKDYGVYHFSNDLYLKNLNKWWDGYVGQADVRVYGAKINC